MLLEQISDELLLAQRFVLGIAQSASYRYREYQVSGRSGTRVVYHPSRQLKALQRWLLRRIISKFAVHPAATAYEKRCSILLNAERHRYSRFLLRMDFENFFPSLTAQDVITTLERSKEARIIEPSWSIEDYKLFVQLVCRCGVITIGAPTSPKLANAICFDLDEQLAHLAELHGAAYTRYADDLFFSTKQGDILSVVEKGVRKIVVDSKHPEQLRLNFSKTRHSSTAGRRVVTGIVLTPDGQLSIGRKKKRYLRSRLHNFTKLSADEQSCLRGWLAYSQSIEPDFINRLILKFGSESVEKAMNA